MPKHKNTKPKYTKEEIGKIRTGKMSAGTGKTMTPGDAEQLKRSKSCQKKTGRTSGATFNECMIAAAGAGKGGYKFKGVTPGVSSSSKKND